MRASSSSMALPCSELLLLGRFHVKRAQAILFGLGEGTAPGAGGEIEAVIHVARVGGELRFLHGVVTRLKSLNVLARLGRERFDLGGSPVGDAGLFQFELVLPAGELKDSVVIVEGRQQVGPACSRRAAVSSSRMRFVRNASLR